LICFSQSFFPARYIYHGKRFISSIAVNLFRYITPPPPSSVNKNVEICSTLYFFFFHPEEVRPENAGIGLPFYASSSRFILQSPEPAGIIVLAGYWYCYADTGLAPIVWTAGNYKSV
jgi:hypothetical protein